MTKGIVAVLNNAGMASSGTHLTVQAAYADKNGNSRVFNINVAFGLTGELTNTNIGNAIKDDCNTQFGTSYGLTDVVLFAAASFL